MIKVKYNAVAETQIHHGSDEQLGIMKTLRRESRRLKVPISTPSSFKDDEERRDCVLPIIWAVYKCLDKDLKSKNYGFYDAFASKVLAATKVKTKEAFLTKLCQSCGVINLGVRKKYDENNEVLGIVDYGEIAMSRLFLFEDAELLGTIRSDHQILMIKLRLAIQSGFEPLQDLSQYSQNASIYKKYFDEIPYIGGNAVRGRLRRIVMKDFLTSVGFTKETPIPKAMYHQLMTGGNITGSTAFEDIELREQYINLCPMVGLLGSAIGNMTIQGAMQTGAMRPVCLEHGNGKVSFWETIGKDFGTRSDTSKKERDFTIEGEDKKAKSSNQMKYDFEVFNTGTVFSGRFVLTSSDELLVSAFWSALKMWKEDGIIGGGSARGYGIVDADIEIPDGACDLYRAHLKEYEGSAFAFFSKTF